MLLATVVTVGINNAAEISSNDINSHLHPDIPSTFQSVPVGVQASEKSTMLKERESLVTNILTPLKDHKTAILTSLANLIDWLLGGILAEIRNAVFLVTGMTPTDPKFRKGKGRGSSGGREGHRSFTNDDVQVLEVLATDLYDAYKTWQDKK